MLPTNEPNGLTRTDPGGPTASVCNTPGPTHKGSDWRVTRLPEATRASQLRRWGLAPDRLGDLSPGARRGHEADDAPVDPDAEEAGAIHGFLQDGGWHAIEPARGRHAGAYAHRGVLHPDEYVDTRVLVALVEEHLGYSVAEVRSVYRQGPLSAEGRALRARIDARLEEVARRGGLMLELARALGWAIRGGAKGDRCDTLERALRRAREATS